MQKIIFFILLFQFSISYSFSAKNTSASELADSDVYRLYLEISPDKAINYSAFQYAILGHRKVNVENKDILTLIDFSKASTEKRFHVIDLKNKEILFSSHVSHGKNSGANYAVNFSNENGSNKSSLGFFVTENTYHGKHGYSLIINGLEKNINDRAKERAIVIHSAAYADPSVIPSSGRLGRSFGCPALPVKVSTPIINTIKNGSLIFIYANDQKYFDQSPILNIDSKI